MDNNKFYKLTAITDKDGNDKSQSRDLYIERINCIATNLRKDDYNRVYADFIQSAEGKPILRSLHTSRVENVEEPEGKLILHTVYSIYVFEEVAAPEENYADAANLLELYLTSENNKFTKGFYYDENKQPHKLHLDLHVGTFTDTALIRDPEEDYYSDYHCRYYIDYGNIIEFYRLRDYKTPMLIHNVGDTELIIKFSRVPGERTIAIGESITFIPAQAVGGQSND